MALVLMSAGTSKWCPSLVKYEHILIFTLLFSRLFSQMLFEGKLSIIERKVARRNNLGTVSVSLNILVASPHMEFINPVCPIGFMSGSKENLRNWFVNYVPFHKQALLSQAKNNKKLQ